MIRRNPPLLLVAGVHVQSMAFANLNSSLSFARTSPGLFSSGAGKVVTLSGKTVPFYHQHRRGCVFVFASMTSGQAIFNEHAYAADLEMNTPWVGPKAPQVLSLCA